MDRYILNLRRRDTGLCLWEISLASILVCLLAAAVWTGAGGAMHAARVRRMIGEMNAILQAARQHEEACRVWPSDWQQMRQLLPRVPEHNAWGYPYAFGSGGCLFWVETQIPGEPGQGLTGGSFVVVHEVPGGKIVRLSTECGMGIAGRLLYEKRNVYAP